MSNTLAKNTTGWKIKSAAGYVDFAGVAFQGHNHVYDVTLDDNNTITVTSTHRFFTPDGREITTRELQPGVELMGVEDRVVKTVTYKGTEDTYDVIESEDHTYFANGVLCHNCEFLSSDALLISSLHLQNMTPIIADVVPINVVNGVVFWHHIKKGGTYMIGIDPATGSGKDYSVITVYEFPSLVQVAEYRSNTMSTNELYGVLKNVLKYLEKQDTMVYFTVENNGVGEGVIALFEADEDPPNAEFISEEGRGRRGMTSTPKSKMRACVNFKEMLEKGAMTISSPILFAELKMFVRSKGSYAAQSGGTDDCVTATLLITRIIEEVATYDQQAFDRLYAGNVDEWSDSDWDGWDQGYDANDEGMPITF